MSETRIWSDEQNNIFNWFKSGRGHLVVQARAGTGKTSTIIEAFGHAPEDKICYCVFNKKNQLEAQGKVTDGRVEVKTLHALGYAFIRNIWKGVSPDSFVERDRIADAAKPLFLPNEVITQVAKLVSFAKNLTINPTLEDLVNIALDRGIDAGEEAELPENGLFNTEALAKLALKALEAAKVRDKQNRISFDDMVWLPVAMGWVKAWYDLVVVDECQDMNLPQLEMATKACKRGGRICVVGDDRQAIYGFRGAASDGMGLMKSKLNAASLSLTTTYRCPKSVVALAKEIVPDYVAAPSAPRGIVDHGSVDSCMTARPGDAILSRVNAPLMPLCLAFLRQGIPARIEGRDIGKQLAAIVKKFKARSVPDCLLRLKAWESRQIKRLTAAGKEAQIEGIKDQAATIIAVAEGASNVNEIHERLERLFQDSDKQRRPAVVLSSVHKAKGLEWDHVYALADTFRNVDQGGEESNIYYVAITRTKKHLSLLSDK
jgi:superfamily I DNA/RNA helicase